MGWHFTCFVCFVVGLFILERRANSEEPAAPIKKLILPGEAFLVEGRPAFVFLPPEKERRQPQPWILYAPTLPPYPDDHEKWMHEQFLAAGVAVAGIDVGALPCSRHCSSGVSASNTFGPSPPPQCPMPGA